MKIRKVKLSDAENIMILRKKTFEKINSKDYKKQEIDFINNGATIERLIEKMRQRDMFCLEKDGEIVGVVDLEGNKIGGLFVKSDLIGKGYGKRLLDFIEKHARKKGIDKVELFSTIYAEGFYKKSGYDYLGKRSVKNDNVIRGIEMEKKLI